MQIILKRIVISLTLLVMVPMSFAGNIYAAPLTDGQLSDLDNNTNWVGECGVTASEANTISSGASAGPAYIMGDSITALAKASYIKKFKDGGWNPTVEGLGSRQIATTPPSPSGLQQLDKDKGVIAKAHAIVIALGTNGSGNSEASIKNDVQKTMVKIKQYNTSSSPVYWVNIIDTRHDTDSKKTNRAINEGVGTDAKIIDWYGTAKSKARLASFNEGVHPTKQADIDLLVDLVYTTVDGSSSDGAADARDAGGNYKYISAGIIPVGGKTVMASTFGGSYISGKWGSSNDTQGVDPPRTSDDNGKGNTSKGIAGYAGFAELSTSVSSLDFAALGGLPEHTKLQISYNGKSVIAERLDVGAGNSEHPLIDLWWETAKLLDFTKGNDKVTLHVVERTTPTTPVDGSANSDQQNAQSAPTGCCPAPGGGNDDGTLSGSTPAEKAFNYFVSVHALSAAASAGIVGNMMIEAGGKTEKLDTHAHNDTQGTHDGIVQWSTSRWAALKEHESGKDPYALSTQLDYVWYELSEGGYKSVLAEIKAATTPQQAATQFNAHYEVSGDNSGNRETAAGKIFGKYGGGATTAPDPTATAPTEGDAEPVATCALAEGGDASGDADIKKTVKVSTQGKFITMPAKYSCAGRQTRIDSRIAADIAYLVNQYSLCADDGLAAGHASHGAGVAVDMRPKNGNGKDDWKNSAEAAARAIGWRGDGADDPQGSKQSCSNYGAGDYGGCMHAVDAKNFPQWLRWMGYNGAYNHGDPWHVYGTAYAHIHIGWDTPNGDGVSSAIIASPRASVYAFPAPIPDDLKELIK